jgi:hypothetical protein
MKIDYIREASIWILTVIAIIIVGRWHWLAALILAIPIWIVMINVAGFLTLPLYWIIQRRVAREYVMRREEEAADEKMREFWRQVRKDHRL